MAGFLGKSAVRSRPEGGERGKEAGGLNLQGGKYRRFSCRFAGKQKTLALGVYPDVSLKLARQDGDQDRELFAQGTDPGEQRKAHRAEAASFAASGLGGFEPGEK